MADNSFNNTVESLFKGMDSFITTKTVVGDADSYRGYNHTSACGCVVWSGSRSIFGRKEK